MDEAGSTRRLVVTLVGIAALLANRKLGLDLDAASQVTLVGLIMGYLGQSAYKETRLALAETRKVEAAASVATIKDAEAVLKGGQ